VRKARRDGAAADAPRCSLGAIKEFDELLALEYRRDGRWDCFRSADGTGHQRILPPHPLLLFNRMSAAAALKNI